MPRKNEIEFILDVQDRASRKLNEVSGSVGRLRTAFLGLASAAATIEIGEKVFEAAIQFQRIDRSLQFVTGSAAGARQEFDFLRRESERLGLEVAVVAEAYGKFTAAAKGSQLAGEGTRQIFLGIAEASRVLSLNSQQVDRAFRAVEQIISKGRVSAEELRQQMGEQIPGAFIIAAKAMGVSTRQLDEMIEKGELTADELLPRLGQELRNIFSDDAEKAGNDAIAVVNRFKNAVFQLKLEIAEGGVLDAITSFAESLTAVAIAAGQVVGGATSPVPFESEILAIDKRIEEIRSLQRSIGAAGGFFQTGPDPLQEDIDRLERERAILVARQRGALGLGGGITPRKSSRDALAQLSAANNLLDETIQAIEESEQKAAERLEKSFKRAAQSIFELTRTPVEEFLIKMREARELLGKGLIDEETFSRYRDVLLENVVEPVDDLKDAVEDTFKFTEQLATQAARNMQDAFADFLFDPFDEGLSGMLANFLNVIRRMLAELLAFEILSGLPGDVGKFFTEGISRNAAGGPGVGLSIVGEHGPELVNFNGANPGRVIPNHLLGSMSGMMFQTNIDARGADPGLIQRLPAIMDQRDKALLLKVQRFIQTGTVPI